METATPVIYASFIKRLNAYGWDSLLILVMSLIVSIGPASAQTTPQLQALMDAGLLPQGTTEQTLVQTLLNSSADMFSLQTMLMPLLISAVYNIAFIAGEWQATPGKRFCGIKVVMADGRRPTLWEATLRHIASGASVFLCWLGFITILFTKEKMALHDMICNTRVVRVTS